MKIRLPKFLLYVICGYFVWTDVLAQVRVWGVVRETSGNAPVSGVVVALIKPITGEVQFFGRSDLDGGYLLADVLPGEYRIRVGTVGYRRFERSISVAGADIRYDIRLEPGILEKEKPNPGTFFKRVHDWLKKRRIVKNFR
ncbi:MAG: carboxypeptidase regulatory-like domain-containing protein [Bacteroidetes Order II. Incertae sedis bacterium]|nr:carboxypeptidase regulatory-like domain-containing protein [Bacteroidetes Order II. bacterium]